MILESGISNYITIHGEKYSYFAGNNYLGLANHPALKQAAINSIKKYGINFSASRETTGTSELHLKLEQGLAAFKNRDDAVVFASGYFGNRILLHALQDRYAVVFADESAHPSILDGIPATMSEVVFYQHCHVEHLETLLKKHRDSPSLIITDGIFPLTGEIAPLDQIYALAEQSQALVVVDDAHATGVLGEHGRGTPEYFHLDTRENIFQTETMSKALGAYGGFISAPKELTAEIRAKSSVYIGSTALPPPIVAAGCAALEVLQQQPELRSRVAENSRYLREQIKNMDFSTTADNTPIIPIFFQTQEHAENLSRFLRQHRIIAPAIHYPVKMAQFLVRLTVSAIHTQEQIDELVTLLNKWRNQHGINND